MSRLEDFVGWYGAPEEAGAPREKWVDVMGGTGETEAGAASPAPVHTEGDAPVLIQERRMNFFEREQKMLMVLQEIRDLAEDRADADCTGDPPRYQPNIWMQIQTMIDEVLK